MSEITDKASQTKTLLDIIGSFGLTTTVAIVVLVAALGWIAFRSYRDRDAI